VRRPEVGQRAGRPAADPTRRRVPVLLGPRTGSAAAPMDVVRKAARGVVSPSLLTAAHGEGCDESVPVLARLLIRPLSLGLCTFKSAYSSAFLGVPRASYSYTSRRASSVRADIHSQPGSAARSPAREPPARRLRLPPSPSAPGRPIPTHQRDDGRTHTSAPREISPTKRRSRSPGAGRAGAVEGSSLRNRRGRRPAPGGRVAELPSFSSAAPTTFSRRAGSFGAAGAAAWIRSCGVATICQALRRRS